MSEVYVLEPASKGKVLLHTSHGDIDIELWSKEAPKACRNFLQLCLEGFYDNTIFHRIIPGFIVQGGDPTGTGDGGDSIYGGPFPNELHPRLKFRYRGLVGVANKGRGTDTNGSQFFITLSRADGLDGQHTLFGKVSGHTVYNVLRMSEELIDKDTDRPLHPPEIRYTEVLWNPFTDIVPRVKLGAPAVEDKEEKEKPKRDALSKKKNQLLSFEEEAQQSDGNEGEVSASFGKSVARGKSAHDLLPENPTLFVTDKSEDRPVDVDSSTRGSGTSTMHSPTRDSKKAKHQHNDGQSDEDEITHQHNDGQSDEDEITHQHNDGKSDEDEINQDVRYTSASRQRGEDITVNKVREAIRKKAEGNENIKGRGDVRSVRRLSMEEKVWKTIPGAKKPRVKADETPPPLDTGIDDMIGEDRGAPSEEAYEPKEGVGKQIEENDDNESGDRRTSDFDEMEVRRHALSLKRKGKGSAVNKEEAISALPDSDLMNEDEKKHSMHVALKQSGSKRQRQNDTLSQMEEFTNRLRTLSKVHTTEGGAHGTKQSCTSNEEEEKYHALPNLDEPVDERDGSWAVGSLRFAVDSAKAYEIDAAKDALEVFDPLKGLHETQDDKKRRRDRMKPSLRRDKPLQRW